MMNERNTTAAYLKRGLAVIPVPAGQKRPVLDGWQTLRLTEGDLPSYFSGETNIGVLNGEPSGGLVDVDLDAPEAVAVAAAFLPETRLVFGRPSKRRSHWEYQCPHVPKTTQYKDIDNKTMLLELRSTGTQTIWPGSTHPSGESVEFDAAGDPAVVEAGILERAVALAATAALLARHWPRVNGSRHDIANALGGYLLRHGLDDDTVVKLVETAARVADDEEWQDRGRAVAATAETLRQGKPATGGPTLTELLDGKVVTAIAKWLGIRDLATGTAGSRGAGATDRQSTQLVKLAESAELFHTADGVGYVTIPVKEHWETWPVKNRAFRRLLAGRFYDATGMAASDQAMRDAIQVLEAKALHGDAEMPVFTRLAEIDGTIYLDLVNKEWEVVEVTADTWRIVQDRKIKFRRAPGMLALPHPVPGGSITELQPFINVPRKEDWVLVVAWLLGALSPTGPFPVLALHGEQGSAKSTTAKVLKKLVDPNKADLRAEPRNGQDIIIAATNGWIIAFDNLDRLRPWLSNALCRLATGGGFSTRELFTTEEEVIFEVQRPAILTGIAEVATRGDLLDRCLIVDFPTISEQHRRTERTLWREFDNARPRILGALLDAVVVGLRNLPATDLARAPRLADFATWVTAAEQAIGWPSGTFLRVYSENRAAANALVLDDPVADALRLVVAGSQGHLELTASNLLAELNQEGVIADQIKKQRAWPKNGRALSAKLHRLAPSLRTAGLQVDFGQTSGRDSKKWISVRLETPCDASDALGSSATQALKGATQLGGDATHDASHDAREDGASVAGVDGVAKAA